MSFNLGCVFTVCTWMCERLSNIRPVEVPFIISHRLRLLRYYLSNNITERTSTETVIIV